MCHSVGISKVQFIPDLMYVYGGYVRTSHLRWLLRGILDNVILILHRVLLLPCDPLSVHLGIGGASSLARRLEVGWLIIQSSCLQDSFLLHGVQSWGCFVEPQKGVGCSQYM